MAINLKGRSFLTLADFTPAEIRYLLDLGHDLKAKRRAGVCAPTMQGKHIVLLFEKTSTRTRCSFEVAATQEGAHVTYLDAGSSQMGKKESLEDSAKVLGRFFDGIEYRGYDQRVVEDLAKWSGVPVWNGLTDADHPTQILADLMTIEEHCKKPASGKGGVSRRCAEQYVLCVDDGRRQAGDALRGHGAGGAGQADGSGGGAVHLCRGPEKRRPY